MQQHLYLVLRDLAEHLKKIPPNTHEKNMVVLKLEEASMWAQKLYYNGIDIEALDEVRLMKG